MRQQTITLKMAYQGRCDFCVVFTMSLDALESNKFAISSHRAFKLDKQALRNYLRVSCEHELHILPNTKVDTPKDNGKNCTKVRPPLLRHL